MIAQFLPYQSTGMFSKLVLDYLNESPEVQPFYEHSVTLEGLHAAIENRKAYPTNRNLIASIFEASYLEDASSKQLENIQLLKSINTFTVCTAHQPNIFTGYLYFIYKIFHSIRLAEELKSSFPQYDFVPVYYMGSEDNDLEELGQVKVDGVKMVWKTKQTGAVGRMKVDKSLLQIISQIEQQLCIFPHGDALNSMLRDSYREGTTIAASTSRLVNHLFASYGLLVLNADEPSLKKSMLDVFKDDLLNHNPQQLVTKSINQLEKNYKVQVNPREINLFYLKDAQRERIIFHNNIFTTESNLFHFSEDEILVELMAYPERFSPNVVLRGLYQETILPNIAFIGGGAETAYWLELKELFTHYQVPFPVLILRNSFLIASKEQSNQLNNIGFNLEDLFQSDFELMNQLVHKYSENSTELLPELTSVKTIFDDIKTKAGKVDNTLLAHIEALQTQLNKKLVGVEKKLMRAEKKKFETLQNKLQKLKNQLFPNNSLQERQDNFMYFYAKFGKSFLDEIYHHSPAIRQEFGILIQDQ
jgi:bacillithiol biosynthesis cysteine-adding enzyme BshC